MSLVRAVPEGLKDREAERGKPRTRPPIPYVPEACEMADDAVSRRSLKVKISANQEQKVAIYNGGTQEHFVQHVQSVKGVLRKMGLDEKYDGYKGELKGARSDLENHDLVKPDDDVIEIDNVRQLMHQRPPIPTSKKHCVNNVANGSLVKCLRI